jgi:hypothetical protein
VIALSVDEQRIANWLRARARTYEEAYARNPFSFHGIRAKLCNRLADAIEQGKHR